MPPECQLFGTLGCHLCEVAEAVLMPFVEHGLLVELVDIADDEAWVCLLYTSIRLPRNGARTGMALAIPWCARRPECPLRGRQALPEGTSG